MPALSDMIGWLQSGQGRLIAAAVLFGFMWVLKSVPWVRAELLTTPRRKQLAVAFLATAPAVLMLTKAVPTAEVVTTALTLFLSAMGLNNLRPSKAAPGPPSAAGAPKEEPADESDKPEPEEPETEEPEEPESSKPGGAG